MPISRDPLTMPVTGGKDLTPSLQHLVQGATPTYHLIHASGIQRLYARGTDEGGYLFVTNAEWDEALGVWKPIIPAGPTTPDASLVALADKREPLGMASLDGATLPSNWSDSAWFPANKNNILVFDRNGVNGHVGPYGIQFTNPSSVSKFVLTGKNWITPFNICKAWCHATITPGNGGSFTVVTNDEYNVASVVRQNSTTFRVNFNLDMHSAAYAVVGNVTHRYTAGPSSLEILHPIWLQPGFVDCTTAPPNSVLHRNFDTTSFNIVSDANYFDVYVVVYGTQTG